MESINFNSNSMNNCIPEDIFILIITFLPINNFLSLQLLNSNWYKLFNSINNNNTSIWKYLYKKYNFKSKIKKKNIYDKTLISNKFQERRINKKLLILQDENQQKLNNNDNDNDNDNNNTKNIEEIKEKIEIEINNEKKYQMERMRYFNNNFKLLDNQLSFIDKSMDSINTFDFNWKKIFKMGYLKLVKKNQKARMGKVLFCYFFLFYYSIHKIYF